MQLLQPTPQQPGIVLRPAPIRTIAIPPPTAAPAPVRTVAAPAGHASILHDLTHNPVTNFVGGTAKLVGHGATQFVNQGVQEAKQIPSTVRMEAATVSHNPAAFHNANEQSQRDYRGFGNKGGLFNQGTITTQQEAKQGSAHGALKIAGDTAMLGSLLIPGAEGAGAGAGLGARVGARALQGAISGGIFGAGAAAYSGAHAGDIAKAAALNAVLGGAIGGAAPLVHAGGKFAVNAVRDAGKAVESRAASAAGLRPENIVNENEAGTLRDFADYRTGAYKPDLNTVNTLMVQARHAANAAGIDVTSGSPQAVTDRIYQYLSQRGEYAKNKAAITQGGYITLPGSGKGGTPKGGSPGDLTPADKEIRRVLSTGEGSNRPESARFIEKNQANLTDAQRLKAAGDDYGQAGLPLPAADHNALLQRFKTTASASAEQPIPSAGEIATTRVAQLKAARENAGTPATVPVQSELKLSTAAPQGPKIGSGITPPSIPQDVASSAENTIKPGAAQGLKPSRFANVTVQNSEKVDELTKQLVQEKGVSYKPQATKAGQDAAHATYGGMDVHQAALDVASKLDGEKLGNINRQDVFNAHEVADRLQKTGKLEDKAAAADIYGKLSEHHTAAGQQIQAAAALAKQSPEGMLYSAIKALKKGGVKITDDITKKVNDALDKYEADTKGLNSDNMSRKQADTQSLSYQKFVDTVNRQIPRKKGDALIGIWRAGLLTGPETAAKVAVSHGITAPFELISKPVSSIVDRLASLATNKRGYTFGASDLAAAAKGYGRGVRGAGIKLKTGLDLPGTGGFERKLGETSRETVYEKIPTRLHASLAKPNFSAEYEMSLQSQARAAAINQGLKGAEREAFVKNFTANPPKDALETAQHEAEHFTNQQKTDLGHAASTLQQWRPGGLPIGNILAPFTRIPSAIGVKGLVDWTPLGVGKAVMKVVRGIRSGNFDQRGFSQDIGRSLTGTGIAAIGFELMAAGRMTLSAPSDPKEKALWQQEGRQRNSIYIGGKVTKNNDGTSSYSGGRWITLNGFGPAGITMGLGGGYRAAHEQGKSGAAALVQASAAGGKLLAEQPYFKGIMGVANALNDPTRYAQSIYDSTIGSIVPAASSQIARGGDATQRAYSPGVVNTLKGEIPGLREKLPKQLDTFGQPVPSGLGGNAFSSTAASINPFYPTTTRNQADPVTHELQRIYSANGSQNAPAFAAPQKNMTVNGQKLKLTPDQMNQYVGTAGPLIHDGISNLLDNPDYKSLTDDQKTKQINDIITGAHTAAKVQLFGDNPKTLSGTERTAILNPTELGKDVQLAGLHLGTGVQPADKTLLTKVYGMDSTKRTAYLNDPKNKYQYDLASFHNDVLNGKYDTVQQFSKQNTLDRQAVTSQYDNKVSELYGMSKANISDYLNAHPKDTGDLTNKLLALDQQLYNGGFESSLKFKDGIAPKAAGSKTATPHTFNFGSTFSKLDSLLKTTEHTSGASRTGSHGGHVALRSFKPSSIGVGRKFGGSSTRIAAAHMGKTPKPPKFPKVARGTVSSKRITLSA